MVFSQQGGPSEDYIPTFHLPNYVERRIFLILQVRDGYDAAVEKQNRMFDLLVHLPDAHLNHSNLNLQAGLERRSVTNRLLFVACAID